MSKKILSFLLLASFPLILSGLYFTDKVCFLCPIEYRGDFVIRNDGRGDGIFAAKRSGNRLHDGVDLLAPIGRPVLAPRAGIVISASRSRGMGKFIIIRHAGNITTIYGHLSEITVREKQLIRQGDIIGRVGKTGNANYSDMLAHLHFEVRKNGIPQDPLSYLE